jgi:hypothetical protein
MGRPCSVAKVTAARSAVEPLHSLDSKKRSSNRFDTPSFSVKPVVLDHKLGESELIAICLLLSLCAARSAT